MTLPIFLLDLALLVLPLLGAWLYLHARTSQRARLVERLKLSVQIAPTADKKKLDLGQASVGLKQFIYRLGTSLPLFNTAQRTEATGKLISAGYRSPQAFYFLVGLSLLSILVFIALALLYVAPALKGSAASWLFSGAAGAYLGSLIPRMGLDYLVKRRQKAIQVALPDALDLLVICTNSGLALSAAIERVANEMAIVAPALSDELSLTAMQLRVSSDIEQVFNALARRTQVDGIRSLVNTFLQSRQYGTSITQTLRVLARSERTARMLSLEEKAAKLSVKIMLPMIVFILPTVLIVVAGPALIKMGSMFSSF